VTGGREVSAPLASTASVPTDALPARGLGRGVAWLPGQVARGWPDLEHACVVDLHGAGFRTSGLADIPDAGAGDRHHSFVTRFAVVGGDRRSALEGLAVGVGAGWALENGVAAWHPTHVEPPIVGPRDTEAQIIVVGIRPADEDLPPPWQRIADLPPKPKALEIS